MWIQGLVGGYDCHCFFLFLSNFFSKSLSQSLISEKLSLSLFCSWVSFPSSELFGTICCFWILIEANHSCWSAYSTVLLGLEWWSSWCFSWLDRCRGLLCSFCFLCFNHDKPISLHKTWMDASLTFLGLGSLSLVGLIRFLFLIGEALGLDWVAMAWLLSGVDWYGAVMVCFCLRYSVIFLCKDGKGFTSVPQGLNLITWVFLSFLNLWISHKVWTISSTSIVSSGRLHEKKSKRKLQFAARLQAISGSISVYILCCFRRIVWCQSKPSPALL